MLLQLLAAKFREGALQAMAAGLFLDEHYCKAAAIVVEKMAERAEHERWTKTGIGKLGKM